jgi:hypothetical protein
MTVPQADATVMAVTFAKTISRFAEFMVDLAETLHKDLGIEYHAPSKTGKPSKKRKQSFVDPHMPKKPKSAYFLFSDAMREQAKKSGETVPAAQKLGELWQALGDQDKAEYQKEADLLKDAYNKEVEKFKNTSVIDDEEIHEDDEEDVAPPSIS